MSQGTDLDQMMPRYQLLTTAGRLNEALKLVRAHVEEHRDDPRVWLVLAQALNNLGEGSDAEAAVRQALDLDPRSFMGLLNLSRALLLQGRQADARAAAEELTRWFPEEAGAHGWLASVHNSGGSFREALASAEQALSLDPSADHYATAVEACSRLGDHEQARSMLADGLAVDPQHRELLLLSSWIANGAAVVGDQTELLTGMLAASPMDRAPLDRLTQEVLGRLRNLALLPWIQAVAFCFLAPLIADVPAGGAAALAAYMGLGVVVRAVIVLRRLSQKLPAGFLKDLLTASPAARTGLLALVAGEVWVLGATLGVGLAATGEEVRWFLALLTGGVLPVFLARYLLHRAAYRALPGFTPDAVTEFAAARRTHSGDRSAAALWLLPGGALLALLALLQQTYTVFGGAAVAGAGLFLLAHSAHFVYVELALRRRIKARAAAEADSGAPGAARLGRPPAPVLLMGAGAVALPLLMLAGGAWLLAAGSVPAG